MITNFKSFEEYLNEELKNDGYSKHYLNKKIIFGGKPRGFKTVLDNVVEDIYNPKPKRVYNELDPYGEESWE